MNKRIAALIFVLIFALSACGGRVPKPKTSRKVIQKYFKKYAKKYPTTIYGQNGVAKVEVEDQQEIHKKFVSVEAYVVLGDGNLRKIIASVQKGPFGWKFVSWEDATGL